MTTIFASFGTAITSLLLSVLITIRRPLVQPDWYLAWWLGAQVVFWAATLLSGLGTDQALALLIVGQLALFSSVPAQYLYAAAALKANASHSVPLAAIALVAALLLGSMQVARTVESLNGGIIVSGAPKWLFGAPIVCIIVAAAFPFAVLRLVANYDRRAKHNVSSLTNADPRWLRTWAWASIAVQVLLLIAALATRLGASSSVIAIWTGLAVQLASTCFVAHRSLTRPGAFFAWAAAEGRALKTPDRASTDADAEALDSYFETAKPHLCPELTAQQLADGLGWAPERLTAAFRHNGLTFFDAVNARRVRELQAMLREPINAQRSLLLLGHEAGFGSKSALYAAFRRHAGLSPAVWRRRLPRSPSVEESVAAMT